MTAHDHREYVTGCYGCETIRDSGPVASPGIRTRPATDAKNESAGRTLSTHASEEAMARYHSGRPPTDSGSDSTAEAVGEVGGLEEQLADALRQMREAVKAISFTKPGQLTPEEGWALIHADDAADAVLDAWDARYKDTPNG